MFDEGSPVIFCDFLKPGADKRLYEESRDMARMKQVSLIFRFASTTIGVIPPLAAKRTLLFFVVSFS